MSTIPALLCEAQAERDHLIVLERTGKLYLYPAGDHPRRDRISALITYWRELARDCKSIEAFRGDVEVEEP